MKCRLDMAGDESSSQLRSFHDIHRPQEAGKVVHLRKLGTSVISLGHSKPCQVTLQERTSLPCCENGLEPWWCQFPCPFFPGGYDSVNLPETLNILGYAETLVHQGNGAFDSMMVVFRLQSQFLYVQIATLLERNRKMFNWNGYTLIFLRPASSASLQRVSAPLGRLADEIVNLNGSEQPSIGKGSTIPVWRG